MFFMYVNLGIRCFFVSILGNPTDGVWDVCTVDNLDSHSGVWDDGLMPEFNGIATSKLRHAPIYNGKQMLLEVAKSM